VIILAALVMAVAVFIAMTPPGRLPKRMKQRSSARNLAPIAIGIGAFGAFIMFEGWFGLVCAIAIVIGVPRLVNDLRRRQQLGSQVLLARQVPQIADMLAAALAAGVAIPNATRAVATALDQPALSAVVRAQELGADPVEAWRNAPESLRAIGHAFARSQNTGAAASSVLHGVADDARRHHRTTVEIAARTAGVRAVAPLAACFLPAFLLLGVVPVVVTLAEDFFRW
jgi:Flp pilus assembly protein TadB